MEQNSNMQDDQDGFQAQPGQLREPAGTNDSVESPGIPQGFKDPVKLTKWVKGFLCVSIAISMLSIWSDYLEHELLNDFKNGTYTSEAEATADAEANDARQGIIGIVYTLVLIATLICFLRWVYRANSNVRKLGAEGLRFTPGWSVGWFFVPIAHVWKPYQVMKEIFKASKNPADWANQTSSPIVGWWWGFWIISAFLGQASFRISLGAQEIDELLTANVVMMISEVVDIPSAIITIVLVGKILEMQMSNLGKYAQSPFESDTRLPISTDE
jgi:hypothetical protein